MFGIKTCKKNVFFNIYILYIYNYVINNNNIYIYNIHIYYPNFGWFCSTWIAKELYSHSRESPYITVAGPFALHVCGGAQMLGPAAVWGVGNDVRHHGDIQQVYISYT